MSTNNWLVKLCSEQPTNGAELEQALLELPPEELMALDSAPTPNVDAIGEKVAFADQMGREMAQKDPTLLRAEENLELGKAHLQDTVASMSDDDAIKVAYVLEHGSEMEKQAFLGKLVGKALTSGIGKKVVKGAVNNPYATTAAAGAGAGALMGGEGNRLGGALGGAAMGGMAGGLAGKKAVGKFIGKGYGRAAQAASTGQNLSRARKLGLQGPARPNMKFASIATMPKEAKIPIPTAIAGPRLSSMAGGKMKNLDKLMKKRPPAVPGAKGLPGMAKAASYPGAGKRWAREMEKLRAGAKGVGYGGLAGLTVGGLGGYALGKSKKEDKEKDKEKKAYINSQKGGISAGAPPPAEGAQAAIASPSGQEAVNSIKEAGVKLAIAITEKGHKWDAERADMEYQNAINQATLSKKYDALSHKGKGKDSRMINLRALRFNAGFGSGHPMGDARNAEYRANKHKKGKNPWNPFGGMLTPSSKEEGGTTWSLGKPRGSKAAPEHDKSRKEKKAGIKLAQYKEAGAAGVIGGGLAGSLAGAIQTGLGGALIGAGLGAITAEEGNTAEKAKRWARKGGLIGGLGGAALGGLAGGLQGHTLEEIGKSGFGVRKMASKNVAQQIKRIAERGGAGPMYAQARHSAKVHGSGKGPFGKKYQSAFADSGAPTPGRADKELARWAIGEKRASKNVAQQIKRIAERGGAGPLYAQARHSAKVHGSGKGPLGKKYQSAFVGKDPTPGRADKELARWAIGEKRASLPI